MKIKFYGTRGSIPTPSTPDFSTSEFGGNTTCFRITDENWEKEIIIDAGSGMRVLGNAYFAEQVTGLQAEVLLTHYHHDHIQGIPFFPQMYMPDSKFSFRGPAMDGVSDNAYTQVQEYLRHEQLPPFFPVPHDRMPSKKNYHDIIPGQSFDIQPFDSGDSKLTEEDMIMVDTFPLNHPNGGVGYHIKHQGVSISICSDSEHFSTANDAFAKICKETDLIICDGQYAKEEYSGGFVSKQGWGHGTVDACLEEMVAAGAKKMVITHHDPSHDDDKLKFMEDYVHAKAKTNGIADAAERIFFAREGMEIEV